MSNWNDFNDAEQQQSFDLIPRNTAAKLRLTIKPGGLMTQPGLDRWLGRRFETGARLPRLRRRGDGRPVCQTQDLVERGPAQRQGADLGNMGAPSSARRSIPPATSIRPTTARRRRRPVASAALPISMVWSSPPASTSRRMAGARTATPSRPPLSRITRIYA